MPPKEYPGKIKGDVNGNVIISYSNYQVNKGIDDNIFLEKK